MTRLILYIIKDPHELFQICSEFAMSLYRGMHATLLQLGYPGEGLEGFLGRPKYFK